MPLVIPPFITRSQYFIACSMPMRWADLGPCGPPMQRVMLLRHAYSRLRRSGLHRQPHGALARPARPPRHRAGQSFHRTSRSGAVGRSGRSRPARSRLARPRVRRPPVRCGHAFLRALARRRIRPRPVRLLRGERQRHAAPAGNDAQTRRRPARVLLDRRGVRPSDQRTHRRRPSEAADQSLRREQADGRTHPRRCGGRIRPAFGRVALFQRGRCEPARRRSANRIRPKRT